MGKKESYFGKTVKGYSARLTFATQREQQTANKDIQPSTFFPAMWLTGFVKLTPDTC